MVATAHKHCQRLIVYIGTVRSVKREDITKVSVLTLLTSMGPQNSLYLAVFVQ